MRHAVIVVLIAVLIGCSGGDGNDGTTNTTLKVLASNVVLGTANANLSKVDLTGVDTETKVLAENVVIDTADNALSSTDLQSALDGEIACNLATAIVGTWSIENVEPSTGGVIQLCNDREADYNAVGSVAFATNGTYSICSGRFAVAGLEYGDLEFSPNGYTIKDKGTILIGISDTLRGSSNWPVVISDVNEVNNTITMISGGAGCGIPFGIRYSKLTRTSTSETCP